MYIKEGYSRTQHQKKLQGRTSVFLLDYEMQFATCIKKALSGEPNS